MNDLFIQAVKGKLRFSSPIGLLSVEDLFDLPLTSTNATKANLDDIAKELYKQLETTQVSFVSKKTNANSAIQLGFDIVKYVIDSKLEENEKVRKESERSSTRQKVMGLIERKADSALEEKSIDELTELLKTL